VPGFMSIASTTPGAELFVPAGDTDVTATPGAINFNFNAPYSAFLFATSSATLGFDDDQGNDIGFGPGQGVVAACKSDGPGDCMFVGGGSGTQSIGLAVPAPPASAPAPELDPASLVGALTLLFGLRGAPRKPTTRYLGPIVSPLLVRPNQPQVQTRKNQNQPMRNVYRNRSRQ
jgi:hypothetical protein